MSKRTFNIKALLGLSLSLWALVTHSDVLPKNQITSIARQAKDLQNQHQSLIDEIKNHSAQYGVPHKEQVVDGAVLFVSFSMPKELLFSLSDEAASFGMPVVLNGLIDGDFKKTIEQFNQLQQEAKKQHRQFSGVSIDPVWFEQFKVQQVPALVVSHRPSRCGVALVCASQTFDIVYGNASLKDALRLIARKGEAASDLAKLILEQGHV